MTDGTAAWWGSDGTEAVGGADAPAPPSADRRVEQVGHDAPGPITDPLAPPPASPPDRAVATDPAVASDLVALPALPIAADPDAAARWMEADAAQARALSDPPARRAPSGRPASPGSRGWIDGSTEGTVAEGPARQAGPARLLPPEERPAPAVPRPRRESRGRHPSSSSSASRPAPARATPEDRAVTGEESVWRRDLREESEFRAQFGEWRASSSAAAGPPGMRFGTVLILLGLALLIVLIALG